MSNNKDQALRYQTQLLNLANHLEDRTKSSRDDSVVLTCKELESIVGLLRMLANDVDMVTPQIDSSNRINALSNSKMSDVLVARLSRQSALLKRAQAMLSPFAQLHAEISATDNTVIPVDKVRVGN